MIQVALRPWRASSENSNSCTTDRAVPTSANIHSCGSISTKASPPTKKSASEGKA